jgi:hypothetical protein
MAVTVAEYLGVRTDIGLQIQPISISKAIGGNKPTLQCPFKNSHCDKALRGDKPICSVRDGRTNKLWIVCSNRLCSSHKGTFNNPIALNDYQKTVLLQVAQQIFSPSILPNQVEINREVRIPVNNRSNYSADFIMREKPALNGAASNTSPVILEMQGGGETTNTGSLTQHVTKWENGTANLTDLVRQTSPLVTNAWRRQQEQFLVKGNAAMLTGGRMVFCIGSMIHDYLMPRLIASTSFQNLRNANWTLALLTFEEDTSPTVAPRPACAPNSIPLKIGSVLFTNYNTFVQAITNQGMPSSSIFNGPYIDLT